MYIAQILIRRGDDGQLAVQFAEKAVALRTETSMVPVVVFEQTLADARKLSRVSAVGGSPAISDVISSDLRRARLGDLVALGPDVAELLDHRGIRCAGCGGYEDEPLDRAASEVGADLDAIVADVGQLIARKQQHIDAAAVAD